ncbi:winged helix-turn-helix transcriptional regulator [Nocardiopsis nanhaiensis]
MQHPEGTQQPPPAVTVPGRPCSAAAALQLVGEKWSLLVVRELLFGVRRFDAIARNTGAPRDRLTARLRALREANIVWREAYQERPARYEYHLTKAGLELAPVLFALFSWGDKWLFDEPPAVLHHRGPDGREHPMAQGSPPVCPTCREHVRFQDVVPRRTDR